MIGLFLVASAASSVAIAEGGADTGEGACGGDYTVQDTCMFVATQTTGRFWASACSIGTPANCYGQSVVHLDVFVDGSLVSGCLEVRLIPEDLGPAMCSGEVEVAIGAEIDCRVTGTAQSLLSLDPYGSYTCQTPIE